MIFAFVPILNYFNVLTSVAALVLGIIGLTRTGRPKGTAIAGAALGGGALLLTVIFATIYSVGFVNTGREIRESQADVAPPVAIPSPSPTSSPEPPADGRVAVTFTLTGDGNTPPQQMEGTYSVVWETQGDCYYSAEIVSSAGEEDLFTADAVTTGTSYVYDLRASSWHVEMITGPAPRCGWTITFSPAG